MMLMSTDDSTCKCLHHGVLDKELWRESDMTDNMHPLTFGVECLLLLSSRLCVRAKAQATWGMAEQWRRWATAWLCPLAMVRTSRCNIYPA